MRNESKIKKTLNLAEKLPYFSFDDLAPIEQNKTYLKILFSRYEKSGKVSRLKKGLYVTNTYLEKIKKDNVVAYYLEFLANTLCKTSYLSLDYVLHKHGILTENPMNFTSITKNKTVEFTNNFGKFLYHKIKDKLFSGFEITSIYNFEILSATKAKALFDFLYLRKNILPNITAIAELRLNLDSFTKKEILEFKKYIKIEKSKKMKQILNYLFE